MAKDLTPTRQGELIPEIAKTDPAWPVVEEFRRLLSENPNGTREIARLPSMAEQREIQAFADRQRAKVRPARMSMSHRQRAVAAIGLMFGAFPSLRNGDTEGLIAAWLMDLEDFPIFAIERACEEIRRGKAQGFSDEFPPTTPKVRKLVDSHAADEIAKLQDAEKVLATKRVVRVVTPEERARATEAITDTVQRWRDEAEERRAQEARARLDADPVHPRRPEVANRLVERMWEEEGAAPPRDSKGNVMVSPSLARNIQEHMDRMPKGAPRRTEGT